MKSKPNVVVFMTDQQIASSILPASPVKTPNIDRMIDKGFLFSNAFCPSPICTPSRSSFQTGLTPHEHMMMHNAHHGKNYHFLGDHPEGTRMLGDVFTEAGYRTVYLGKWDSGLGKNPTAYGYNCYIPLQELSAMKGTESRIQDDVRIPNERDEHRSLLSCVSDTPAERMAPFKLAEEIERIIKEKKQKPFYIFASCTEPHVPSICPKEFADLYREEEIELPANFHDAQEKKPLPYLRHYNKHNFSSFNGDEAAARRFLKHYYGTITMIDAAFGRILDSLETRDLLKDTLVLFVSDHGELAGAHGFVGKEELMCEELIRVPVAVSGEWLSRSTGGEISEWINLTDFFATACELVGVENSSAPRSRSLLPLLRQENVESKEFPKQAFCEHHGSSGFNTVRMIRSGPLKYVFRPQDIQDELYDLERDPYEMNNRIDDPAYYELLADLRAELVRWMEETMDQAAKTARYLLLDKPY